MYEALLSGSNRLEVEERLGPMIRPECFVESVEMGWSRAIKKILCQSQSTRIMVVAPVYDGILNHQMSQAETLRKVRLSRGFG
jgi:hypothetical protein